MRVLAKPSPSGQGSITGQGSIIGGPGWGTHIHRSTEPPDPWSRRFAALTLIACTLVGCASERSAWLHAESEGTVSAYEAYSREHPGGEHAAAARERIKQLRWDEASRSHSIPAYEKFRRVYPSDSLAAKAAAQIAELQQTAVVRAERDAWEKARAEDTDRAYASFLRRHPHGSFAAEAKSRQAALATEREDMEWRETDGSSDIAVYRTFLEEHPQSRYAATARERIAMIVATAMEGAVVDVTHTATRDPLPLPDPSGAATLLGTSTPDGTGIEFTKPVGTRPPKGHLYLITTATLRAKASIELDLATDVRFTVDGGDPLQTYEEGGSMTIVTPLSTYDAGPKRWWKAGTIRLAAGQERSVRLLHVVPEDLIGSARLTVGGQEMPLPESIEAK